MDNLHKLPGYAFFTNTRCEFFPCHKGIPPQNFNCLFCYCPLYALGDGCGGNFTYTKDGIKDCSACTIPHRPEGYAYIMSKWPQISDLAKHNRRDQPDEKADCSK